MGLLRFTGRPGSDDLGRICSAPRMASRRPRLSRLALVVGLIVLEGMFGGEYLCSNYHPWWDRRSVALTASPLATSTRGGVRAHRGHAAPGRMRIGVADPQEFWAPGRAQLQVIEIWESKEQYDRVAGSEIAHG